MKRVWIPVILLSANCAFAGNESVPGKIIEEEPTLKCLGVRWMVSGDDNRNARVEVRYRKVGEKDWNRGLDLFRVDIAGMRKQVRPPAGTTLFAGSVFDLEENTGYQVSLLLVDADGGGVEKLVGMKTWIEPKFKPTGRMLKVKPGQLAAVLQASKPGDTLLLGPGTYKGTFQPRSGTPDKPIMIQGVAGKTILDGGGASNTIGASGLHDVFFEGLTVQNSRWGIAVNGGARLSIRRCRIRDVDHGFVAQKDGTRQKNIYIADNVFTGRATWPRTKGIEGRRGIQIAGTGHVVCYNRFSGFADAIDTYSVYPCSAIDFYNNEISECTDDGIEMDYSEHNTRCFDNRLTNVFMGISAQPAQGGPVYIFRNAMYNVGHSTFKLHNHTSGVLMFHNTSVKSGMPLVLSTPESVTNCISRNNLFIGTTGNYAYESAAKMRNCDFDHDGFGGQWKQFMKWNARRYTKMTELKSGPVYTSAIRIEPAGLFDTDLKPPADVKTKFKIEINDLRLKAGSGAVDRGVVLYNINDGFSGKAPDLGAYQLGAKMPHYGPRK